MIYFFLRLRFTSPPIRKTFAADTLERNVRALNVIYAQLNAIVPTKVKFVGVLLKVLLADVVKRAV